jgi:hypothetical protein
MNKPGQVREVGDEKQQTVPGRQSKLDLAIVISCRKI